MKNALIVQGGWPGHEPAPVSERFAQMLRNEGFNVEVSDTLDSFSDAEKLKTLNLIVPVWTMGSITQEQCEAVSAAVASGVGIAGCHGGMCDAFRESVLWQFMTGGNWVAHPGDQDVEYTVNIKNSTSPITEGISDFKMKSEQYYLHVDPTVEVLATTRFPTADGPHTPNGAVDMPTMWTKRWGQGRVFYNALGHDNAEFDIPEVLEITRRGFLWAAKGRNEND